MSDTVEAPAPARMLDLLSGFVHELRAAGLPVSMTENLAATLVKHASHRKAFDLLFDVYFAIQPFDLDDEAGPEGQAAGGSGVPVPGSMPGGGAGGGTSAEELAA